MSSITGMANITTDKASSSEASSKLTKQQMNQNIVLSMLHIFLSLLEYTNLWDFCHTCQLLFNFKKHLNYKLNRKYSFLYYSDKEFRTYILTRIHNSLKQLYLNLSCFSIIENEYYQDTSSDINKHLDLSILENVYYVNLANFNITDVSSLRYIDTLNLHSCLYIKNISTLKNIRNLSLCGCTISNISMLGNVDSLDLSFCNNIIDISPLKNVRVLDLSFCDNIINVSALTNVSVLNIAGCHISCNTICELLKNAPTLVLYKDMRKYNEFREKYFRFTTMY